MKTEAERRAQADWREKNRDRIRAEGRALAARNRLEVFEQYGMKCADCGFDDLRALTIDHINNDGAEERRSLGGRQFSGEKFYRDLKRRGWPEGYQTLCMNCQFIKHVEFREASLVR